MLGDAPALGNKVASRPVADEPQVLLVSSGDRPDRRWPLFVLIAGVALVVTPRLLDRRSSRLAR